MLTNTGTSADLVYTLPLISPGIQVFLEDDGISGNGLLQLRSAGGAFDTTVFANPAGSLTINCSNPDDTLTINNLPDFTAGISIGTEVNPFESLTLAGTVVLAANKNLAAYTEGQISMPNATSAVAVSGTGSINLNTFQNIVISSGASMSVVDGDLDLTANADGSRASFSAFSGIIVSGMLSTTGVGNITLSGTGGRAAMLSPQLGIDILGGVVSSLATGPLAGKIKLNGYGGQGSFATTNVDGVAIHGVGAVVQSVSGDIQINGTGGKAAWDGIHEIGPTSINRGIALTNSGQIRSLGTGDSAATIYLFGFGGTGGNSNYGMNFGTNALLTSVDGDVFIQGMGSGKATGAMNYGVYASGGEIQTTGTGPFAGSIQIIGNGGGTGLNGSASSQNQGVRISGSTTKVDTVDGNISISGVAAPSNSPNITNSDGVHIVGGGTIQATGKGSVELFGAAGGADLSMGVGLRLSGTIAAAGIANELAGNSMVLDSTSLSMNMAGGSLTIRPLSDGFPIQLGQSEDTNETLALSNDELSTITADTLQIGTAASGSISVTADIAPASVKSIKLFSASAIQFAGGSVQTGGGNLYLSPGTSGQIQVLTPGTDAAVGSNAFLSFLPNSHLTISLNGTVVDSQYDQFNVIGKVILTGLNLDLGGAYSPKPGDQFTIVNGSAGPIIGTFNNLPDGEIFHIGAGAVAGDYIISYHGGDGNDVVITAISLTPTLTPIPDPLVIPEDADEQQIGLGGIGPGFYGHSVMSVTATNSNQDLITDPQVDYETGATTGLLKFMPIANQFGSTVITVTVRDDGPDGSNTFTRSFTVVVNPVNDPPSFDNCVFPPQFDGDDPPLVLQPTPCDVSAPDENPVTHGPASQRIIPDFVFNIQLGPPNESGTATFLITYDNPDLFAVPPAIRPDLALTYTPKPNAHGTSMVTVVLDDGGAGNHTSPPVKFPIQITKPYPLHNTLNAFDVVGSFCPPNLGAICPPDGSIVAFDVITIINYINARGSGPIPPNAIAPPYLDVIPDNQIVAEDALKIVNYINAHPGQSQGQAEGESLDSTTQASSPAPAILDADAATVSNSTAASDSAPVDLLSLLAADAATVQLKRRRVV